MLRILPLVIALPLVVSFGVAEGLWTNRWGYSQEVEIAAARLADIPTTIGDWEGKDLELDARQLELGQIKGYLRREYVQRGTGNSLSVLIVCGRPGPISVHTPDVCYAGAGYGMVDKPVQFVVEAGAMPQAANFWMAKFQKAGVVPEPLQIHWSWNATGAWQAPGNPRWTFARYGVLYKLYIVRELPSLNEPVEKDPSADFLRLLLPAVGKCLHPAPGPV